MPHIYLCFLWHMHQPFYKDLVSGDYRLPWTRLHALKDYYGMVHILEEFPRVRQTFNLVPSMMAQVEEYAAGTAVDPYLEVALKPAEDLTPEEQDFLLRTSFHAHPERMIRRYARYGELFDAFRAQETSGLARRTFGTRDYRDLQVLSQLAWFEEQYQASDPAVRELVTKGRDYTLEDQKLMGAKQREILSLVVPEYRRLAASGQIEISTTPFYHPILPLICDSNIAGISHPNVPLPPRFRYPGDARRQLELARDFMKRRFSSPGRGLWPSEGSVSDEVFAIAAEEGFEWAATDSGVLARTLGRTVGVEAIYRPYRWKRDGQELGVIFRDHFLSDLIGFVYSGMNAEAAAQDFLQRIRDNCRGILASGRDALVPIILDGENAWEHYVNNGRPFLRDLYRRISDDPQLVATTVSDALSRIAPQKLDHIFPGSWINANFDVWIGAEEDNQAWTQLLRAREVYELAREVNPVDRGLAYEELLIAEGSDWCWWYGPEHTSAHRAEFDQLFRGHLANVYRALHRPPPEELSRPILRVSVGEWHVDPSGSISPTIDGEVTSYFEWIGAGQYRVDERSGSMHGKKFLVQDVFYGSDGMDFYLRVDFHPGFEHTVSGLQARLNLDAAGAVHSACIQLNHLGAVVLEANFTLQCAFRKVLEVRVPLGPLGVEPGAPLRFQLSLWEGGLPIDAIPQQDWLTMASTDPGTWWA